MSWEKNVTRKGYDNLIIAQLFKIISIWPFRGLNEVLCISNCTKYLFLINLIFIILFNYLFAIKNNSNRFSGVCCTLSILLQAIYWQLEYCKKYNMFQFRFISIMYFLKQLLFYYILFYPRSGICFFWLLRYCALRICSTRPDS